MKRVNQILYSVVIFFLVAVIVLLGAPRLFKIQTLVIESGSMIPTYNIGDLVYAVPTDFEKIEKDDVITYILNEDLLLSTHRVVDIDKENQELYTKGDNNDNADGAPIQYPNVVGVVKFSIPKVGMIWMALQQTFWKIIAGTGMAALIMLMIILKILESGEEEAKEEKKAKLEDYKLPPMPPGWGKGGGKPKTKRGAMLLLGVAGLSSISITIAFLTFVTNSANNQVDIGRTPIKITEETKTDGSGDPNEGILWEADAKKVTVTAETGEDIAPHVVRVMIVPLFKDADGVYVEVPFEEIKEPSGGQTSVDLGDFTFHFDTNWATNWFYKDGFYYYKEVMNSGDQTKPLLTGITIKSGTEVTLYKDIQVEIEVMADSLQAAGGAPLQEWGVNVDFTQTPPEVKP